MKIERILEILVGLLLFAVPTAGFFTMAVTLMRADVTGDMSRLLNLIPEAVIMGLWALAFWMYITPSKGKKDGSRL